MRETLGQRVSARLAVACVGSRPYWVVVAVVEVAVPVEVDVEVAVDVSVVAVVAVTVASFTVIVSIVSPTRPALSITFSVTS